MSEKKKTAPVIKSEVEDNFKREFNRLLMRKGFNNESECLRYLARDFILKNRTHNEILLLQRIECEKLIQLQINGIINYEENGQVKNVFGLINAPEPML